MNNWLSRVFWIAAGTAALLPAAAEAQVPFSSTQSPGMGPFNRAPASLPVNTPPRPASNLPTGLAGAVPGGYPLAAAVGPIDPDHRLGPRDVLSYRVAEDRDNEPHQLVVTDSGEVQLPLGSLRVKASGKTTQQLASDIKNVLEREYYKPGHATISLGLDAAAQNGSKGKAFITGEVATKGVIDVPTDGDLTVYKAILQLGGFTPEADMKNVFIYRKGAPQKGIRVDCKAVSNGETDKDVVLQPGDTIKVKKRFFDWQY